MTVTVQDFDNAKDDLEFVSKIANVDYTALTATNRDGVVVDTVIGRLAKLGYIPPIAYAGSILFAINDTTKTIVRSSVVYAPLPDQLPFTTSGTWVGDDENKFFVVQDSGAITALQTNVANLITLSGVAANATSLGNFTVSSFAAAVIGASKKIKEALQLVGDYLGVIESANWKLVETITPTATGQIDITIDNSTYQDYRIVLRGVAPNAGGGTYLKVFCNNDSSALYSYNFCSDTAAFGSILTGETRWNATLGGMINSDKANVEILLGNLNASTFTTVELLTAGSNSGVGFMRKLFGTYKVLSAITSLNLAWQSQNFKAIGSIKVYAR